MEMEMEMMEWNKWNGMEINWNSVRFFGTYYHIVDYLALSPQYLDCWCCNHIVHFTFPSSLTAISGKIQGPHFQLYTMVYDLGFLILADLGFLKRGLKILS